MSALKTIIGIDPSVALGEEDDLYSSFYIKRKSRLGRDRLITAPCDKLKEIQRIILEKILSPMVPHQASAAFYHGRSTSKNAHAHHLCSYLYKTDVSNFFTSIKVDVIERMFKARFNHLSTSAILEIISLTTEDGCLPQGAPTSPHLSNLVLYDFDDYLFRISSRLGATYTRYADDITISASEAEVLDLLEPIVQQETSKLGLQLNPKKTYRFGPKHRKIITGLDVSSEKIRPPRSFRKKVAYLVRKCESHPLPASTDAHRVMGYLSYWESVSRDDSDMILLKERMKYVQIFNNIKTQ